MKRMLRTVLFLAAICGLTISMQGQVITRSTDTAKDIHPKFTPPKPKGPKPISHELSAGFRISTDGLGIFCDIGKVKSNDLKHSDMFYNVRFWQIEIDSRKDPTETKVTGQGGSGNNNYIYGKINNMYVLKLGRGFTKMIAGKPDPGSVSIHWIAEGGLAVGLLKPYYLNVYSDPSAIKYSDNTKGYFLDQQVIEGSAGFLKGVNEIKVVPGGHIKTGIHFDFSANRTTLIGVETGVNFEYYSQAVQIMANASPTPYFGDLYVSIQYGKRH